MEPAFGPAPALQAGVPATLGLPRVHRGAGSRPRANCVWQQRRLSYRELEATTRYLGGERRDLTVSYVWAKGTADLNNYDQFFGNLRNPIIRSNENNLIPTDVRHRLLVRGTSGLPGQVGFRAGAGDPIGVPMVGGERVPGLRRRAQPRRAAARVRTLDFTLARPWRFKRHRFRAGLKLYNVFGASADRDVQNNVTSPDYGRFFNPIERSIGFTFGSR